MRFWVGRQFGAGKPAADGASIEFELARIGRLGLWAPSRSRAALGSLIAIAGAGAVSLLALRDPIPKETVASSLYLLVVIASVVIGRLLPGLLAALLAFVALAYWFSPPAGTFTPGPSDLLALVEFLIVGVIVAQFLARAARSRELLAAQNMRLQELDQMKDEFLALVSHELRTPLTSIQGYLEILRDDEGGGLTAAQAEFLATVDRNVARLARLVNDLLFLIQVEGGRLPLDHHEVDLARLLEEAAAAARPAAEKKRIDLRVEARDDLTSVGDRARLAQLIDNLVSNAIKFTEEGGRVELRGSQAGHAIEVEVSDSGIGIAADEMPRLFAPFFRTSAASRGGIGGTGLGLAISQAIAHAHGTAIEVRSTPGQGTTFRFTLPHQSQPVLDGDASTRSRGTLT